MKFPWDKMKGGDKNAPKGGKPSPFPKQKPKPKKKK